MVILRETTSRTDALALAEAWAAPKSFAFLPAKTSVDEDWVRSCLEALPAQLAEGHFALLTSGSTGQPKLVIGARQRAEELTRVLHGVQESEDVAETILTLPLSYCYAFVNQWLWSRVLGRRLVCTDGFADPGSLRIALARAEDAMLCLVGAQLPLLRSHFQGERFPGVTRLHFAGGPFPQGSLEELGGLFPSARVYNNYGCAEAMPRLTLRSAQDSPQASNVGAPIPGVQLKLGAEGELLFQSAYGALALQDREGLQEIALGSWLPSGDLAELEPDGSWRLLGRANQVFKRFGEKVALSSLLETVQGGGWQAEAQFYREADSMGEEGYVLLLSPAPQEAQMRTILRAFRAKHPRTHWPLRVESVERMPLLPSGKVHLSALPSLDAKVIHWRNRI